LTHCSAFPALATLMFGMKCWLRRAELFWGKPCHTSLWQRWAPSILAVVRSKWHTICVFYALRSTVGQRKLTVDIQFRAEIAWSVIRYTSFNVMYRLAEEKCRWLHSRKRVLLVMENCVMLQWSCEPTLLCGTLARTRHTAHFTIYRIVLLLNY